MIEIVNLECAIRRDKNVFLGEQSDQLSVFHV